MCIIIFGVTFWFEKPDMEIEKIQTIEVNSGAVLQKPSTTYHFMDETNNVNIVGDVDYNKVGEYNVKFELNTVAGKYEKEAKIKVVDTVAPEIVLKGEEEYKISYNKEFEEPGFVATDKVDGDLTGKIISAREEIDTENFNVIYKVEDLSGNKTEKTRKVTIVDDIPPEIKLNGNETLELLINSQYVESGATAIDEKDGDLSNQLKISGEVNTAQEGTYYITYSAVDTKGNEGVAKRTVIVKKESTPTVPATPVQNVEKKGVIYLTFDDGPSSNITPKILDILKQKNVKATFFIINYNAAGEQLVKREINEGHTVAIHGYSHDYAQIYKSDEAYMQNLTKLQERIRASTGYTATITRFPGGSSNTISKKYNIGIMTRLTKLVVQKGFKYFDWNVSSGDAGGASNSDQVYNNVISGLSKNKANVVLMHDFSTNQKVLEALPRIIDYGLANGYSFERITEATPMVTHKPNN